MTVVAPPIRVCFVMLKAYPLFNPEVKAVFGGAEVDFYRLATELALDPNFRVSCIVADYGQHPVEIRQGVTLIKSAYPDRESPAIAWKLWQALRRADADIYVREMYSPVTVVSALYTRLNHCGFVYRTASILESNGTCLRHNPLLGRAFIWSLRHADAVIAQNEIDCDNLSHLAGVNAVVLRNADHLPVLTDQPRNTVLWVGRSAHVKRPDLFLRMARQFPATHFTMVCQEASGDARHYADIVAQAQTIPNLTFVPRVPFSEIDAYFQCARIFVNTSDSEGFPNTFVQATKCAAPILSLNVNPDNFLDRHRCGLFAAGDWNTFTDMLTRLLEPQTTATFARHARLYAEQHHDITKIIEQYKTIFRRIRTQSSHV